MAKKNSPHYHIILVPSLREGNGIGHLKRALQLAEKLKKSTIYLAAGGSAIDYKAMVPSEIKSSENLLPEEWKNPLFVLDQRETSSSLFASLKELGPLVGIDEGGTLRSEFDYLIDTIPPFLQPNNMGSTTFLTLPAMRKTTEVSRKILISFGGEDKKRLAEEMTLFLIENSLAIPEEITVVQGPSSKPYELLPHVNLINAPDSLGECFKENDLLLTSFGFTAFEGVAAGLQVILYNPSEYHEKLSTQMGFPSLGFQRLNVHRFKAFRREEAARACQKVQAKWFNEKGESLDHLISRLEFSSSSCLLCQSKKRRVIERGRNKSYWLCLDCGLEQMVYHFAQPIEYTADYFDKDYIAQYGKSYLDDFEHIKGLGLKRLKILLSCRSFGYKTTFLDIGCAYGAFLAAVKEHQFKGFGIDPFEGAIKHLTSKLGLKGSVLSFPDGEGDTLPGDPPYDVVTMWYVIEHFSQLEEVLTRVQALVKPGGYFCFSTPNGQGISRKSNPEFFQESPSDHYSIWNPQVAKEILSRFDFTVKKVNITGHHPERIPVLGKLVFLKSFLLFLSRSFGWGDTFEIYAVRQFSAQKEPSSQQEDPPSES